MPKLSMEEMWPLSGATVGQGLPLGFTWPCLVKMDGGGFPGGLFNFYKTGTIGTITAYATQTGTVQCNSPEPTWLTFLWVAILVFLHFALTILLVVWGALKLYGVKWPKPDKSSKDKGSMAAPYWPALLVAALPVLSVGCFGEVAQHVCHTGFEPRTSKPQSQVCSPWSDLRQLALPGPRAELLPRSLLQRPCPGYRHACSWHLG